MGRLGMDPSLILRNKKCGGGTPGTRERERGGRSHTLFCNFSLYIRPVGAGSMHCSTHKLVFKKDLLFFSFAFLFSLPLLYFVSLLVPFPLLLFFIFLFCFGFILFHLCLCFVILLPTIVSLQCKQRQHSHTQCDPQGGHQDTARSRDGDNVGVEGDWRDACWWCGCRGCSWHNRWLRCWW